MNYGEADWALCKAQEILGIIEEIKESMPDKMTYASFFELVSYPAAASMNQLKLMLYAGKISTMPRRKADCKHVRG